MVVKEAHAPQEKKRPRARSIGLHAMLIVAALIALFPVVFIVSNSFTPENDILRRIDTEGSAIEKAGAIVDKAIPDSLYLDNYKTVIELDDGIFFTWFRNSILVASATTVIGVFLAATAAYAFSRYRFPGARQGLMGFLIIQMFPGIILIVPLFNIMRSLNVRLLLLIPALIGAVVAVWLFISKLRKREAYGAIAYALGGLAGAAAGYLLGNSFSYLLLTIVGFGAVYYVLDRRVLTIEHGRIARIAWFSYTGLALVVWALFRAPDSLRLLDNPWGLVFAYSSIAIPFSTYMLKGYFDTIPYELEQAGMVDGLSPFGAFWRIAIPLAVPGLAVTAFFSFITAWNEFMFAFTFNLSSKNFTLPPGLQTFVSQFRTEWGAFSAAAILVSIPALIVFFLAQRFLVGGLTAGGTKQ
jgi:ABC-type maltose transport system permease subunit